MAQGHSTGWRPIGLVLPLVMFILGLVPEVARAQAAPAPPAMASAITASFGAGFGVQYCCPDQPVGGLTGSIQVPMGSRWFVEGQFQIPTTTRLSYDFGGYPNQFYVLSGFRNSTEHRFSGGGSVLYRLMAGRQVSAFVGAGLIFRYRSTSIDNTKVCQPIVPGSCYYLDQEPGHYVMTDSYVLPQVSAGLDVSVTRLITLFGALRIDDGVTPFGGVRVAITTRPAAPLTAPDVRVSVTNGGVLRGRLVSLTATEVVIRQSGRSVVLPIGDVQRVTKTSHRLRNGMIAGAILGYVSGYFLSCGTGDEEDCWPEVGALVAGIGVGAGALTGALMNRRAAADDRDVLYAANRRTTTMSLAPIVSPTRKGAAFSMTWR